MAARTRDASADGAAWLVARLLAARYGRWVPPSPAASCSAASCAGRRSGAAALVSSAAFAVLHMIGAARVAAIPLVMLLAVNPSA